MSERRWRGAAVIGVCVAVVVLGVIGLAPGVHRLGGTLTGEKPVVRAQPATVVVGGVVRDADGRPAAGVKIYVLRCRPGEEMRWVRQGSTLSDAKGQFRFDSLPRPCKGVEYSLIAAVPHKRLGQTYTQLWASVGSRESRGADTGVVIQLWRLGESGGRVVDRSGRGVAGVAVRMLEAEARDGELFRFDDLRAVAAVADTVTDGRGFYRFADIPVPSRITVRVSKRGYARVDNGSTRGESTAIVERSARVRGRVVDRSGHGVRGVRIWGCTARWNAYGRGVTDANGLYELDLNPSSDSYRIVVEDTRGFVTRGLRDVRVIEGRTVKVPDIVASPGVTMRCRVVDASTGRGLARPVGVRALSYAAWSYCAMRTDGRGNYTGRVLPGEEYEISCSPVASLYENETRRIRVPSSGPYSVDLRLRKIRTVTGLVVDERGRPVDGAIISAPPYFACTAVCPAYGSGRGGADGRFEMGIGPEFPTQSGKQVTVEVWSPARRLAAAQPVPARTLLAGKARLVVRNAGRLRVIVRNSDGTPASGVNVWLSPRFPDGNAMLTDATGAAVFSVLPGRRYRATVEDRWQERRSGEVTALADGVVREVTLKFRPR